MRIRAFLLMILIAGSARAATCVLPLPSYIDSLGRIRTLLDARQVDLAKSEARNLAACDVDSPAGRFGADAALLQAIAATGRDDGRLAATIAALRGAQPRASAAPVDPRLVEKLRAAEAPRELRAGGEVGNVPITEDPRAETIAKQIARFFKWLWKKINDLWDWFRSWWPTTESPAVNGSFGGTPWLVGAVVILIVGVLTILALEVARRSRARAVVPVIESDPVASRRDEDPLSRGANEWERYAAQLAASGRIREAIRAWYHAVLVTLYGASILHFRKGRTNWEYVAALAPDVAWRGAFVQLTRRFEEEWYGHDESGAEALDECSALARRIVDTVRRRGVAA